MLIEESFQVSRVELIELPKIEEERLSNNRDVYPFPRETVYPPFDNKHVSIHDIIFRVVKLEYYNGNVEVYTEFEAKITSKGWRDKQGPKISLNFDFLDKNGNLWVRMPHPMTLNCSDNGRNITARQYQPANSFWTAKSVRINSTGTSRVVKC